MKTRSIFIVLFVILMSMISVLTASAQLSGAILPKASTAEPPTATPTAAEPTPVVKIPAEIPSFVIPTVETPAEIITVEAEIPENPADDSLYNEAMALFREEKYWSARQAFIESNFGDWEEMAEKCIRTWPKTGEVWRDPTQWLQDMELNIVIDQPEDTAMFVRIYKDNKPVSYLFIAGPDKVTVNLPGNGYYVIKDGIGREWYGIKEAFGRSGSYETMSFDDYGTESVYLQSYYAYTITINMDNPNPDADDIYTQSEDWENFMED